ncbi:MAG: DUF3160 domain-containing protein [Anaerolineales bacterium]
MRIRFVLAFVILGLAGCQASQSAPSADPTASLEPRVGAPASSTPSNPVQATSTASTPATPSPSAEVLPPFTVDFSRPFSDVALTEWHPTTYGGMAYTLPVSSLTIANPHVVDGLTGAERTYLWKNGFVIIHSQENQFSALRGSVGGGQSYFLTVDAAYHALHQNFDDTLKALEREYIRQRMQAVLQATLAELFANSAQWQGTSIDAEGTQSIAYLSVALKLFDPTSVVDPSVREVVDRQIAQIMAGNGKDYSALFPDFQDDYGAYKPVGHYAGDPDLESYFRGMTWLGRMHFMLSGKSRVPLIITLALRRGTIRGESASLAWGEIQRILDFIVGPSDDAGPLEYAALMDQVYGNRQTYAMLADDSQWQEFLSHGDELPAPQINSLFLKSTTDLTPERGWRFMGQRFTIDAFIFQNLIDDRVKKRHFPSGLDVMAVFGSSTARSTLTDLKMDAYENYGTQFSKLVQGVQAQPASQWTGRFYDSWLYSFFPLLGAKGAGYPPFMNTAAWGYKEMNSGLGSWAELKHDTVLYSKMPEGLGGGGPPGSGPAPAYVEPDPNAFYRMAFAAQALSQGLMGMDGLQSLGQTGDEPLGILLQQMADLGDRFQKFGDIAAKEIRGDPLTGDDYAPIWYCLGWVECSMNSVKDAPPVPVVAAVSGYSDEVLEAAVGFVDRIYVVVPLEGKLQVAQGGVFTYYEFTQPRSNRLTDQQWRDQLVSTSPPALPAWAPTFVLSGGKATLWTVFRINDWYIVTNAGDKVRVHEQPSTSSRVLNQMDSETYFQILDGPVNADGYSWWKIEEFGGGVTGWIVENQAWYERA